MSKSPFSRAELLPQEERLWINPSEKRLKVSFAKASTLQERRVAITPEGVKQLCQLGHEIIIQKDLGLHAGFENHFYSEAGAEVTADEKRIFSTPFVVKVDPFTITEIDKVSSGCTLLSALQIKTKKKLYFEKLLDKKITAIGLEFIREGTDHFPFVESLGEISGQSAVHIASELTTHDDPIRIVYDVIHYGVPNIPSRYPKTSSIALNALVVSFLLKLTANGGLSAGFLNSHELQSGVYTYDGYLTSNLVADWFPLPFRNLSLLTL
jgi:alanine dehydrogenase